jgi:hypothetical protein
MNSAKTGMLLPLLLPATCYAYVDPGFLGMIGQFAYLILFGVIGAFILRPYSYIKSLFSRRKGDTQSTDPKAAMPEAEPQATETEAKQ